MAIPIQPPNNSARIAESQSTKRQTNERRRFGDRRRKNARITFSERRSGKERRNLMSTNRPAKIRTAQQSNSPAKQERDKDSPIGQNIDVTI